MTKLIYNTNESTGWGSVWTGILECTTRLTFFSFKHTAHLGDL